MKILTNKKWQKLRGSLKILGAIIICSLSIQAANAQKSPPPTQSELNARLMGQILLGEIIAQDGENLAAAHLLLQAATTTLDERLYLRAAQLAIASQDAKLSEQVVRAWLMGNPTSEDAHEMSLQLFIALGQTKSTPKILNSWLMLLEPEKRIALINSLPELYQKIQDKDQAAKLMEQGLSEALKDEKYAANALISIAKVKTAGGELLDAIKTVEKINWQNKKIPPEYAELGIQIIKKNPELEEAHEYIKNYLSQKESAEEIHIEYLRTLISVKQKEKAEKEAAAILEKNPNSKEALLIQSALYAETERKEQAKQSLEKYLQKVEESDQEENKQIERDRAYLLYAIITDDKNWLSKVKSPELSYAAGKELALAYTAEGDFKNAVETIKNTKVRTQNEEIARILLEARIIQETKDYKQSYNVLNQALERFPDDEDIIYNAAMMAEKSQMPKEMEKLLRQIIKQNPESPHSYNALGYYLANKNIRLREAEALIKKAVKLAPEDQYIQDSLGWVKFRLGQPRLAKKILSDAYKKAAHPEIAAHLGEVLWELGEKEKAREIMLGAYTLEKDDETLNQTLKRLKIHPEDKTK